MFGLTAPANASCMMGDMYFTYCCIKWHLECVKNTIIIIANVISKSIELKHTEAHRVIRFGGMNQYLLPIEV